MRTSSFSRDTRPWRFSLRTLFLLTLLVAVVVWVTSWPLWDLDERIILATWVLAVTAAVSRSRKRERRGIWQSGLLGGLVPAAAVLFFYILPDNWVGYSVAFGDIPWVLIWIALIGSLAGMLLAAAFTPGGLTQLSPGQREERLQHRLVIFVSGCVLFILIVGAQSLYAHFTAWKFRGGWDRRSFGMEYRRNYLDLATDGSRLAVTVPISDNRLQRMMMIWRLEPFDRRPALMTRIPTGSATALAPHGRWIAVMQELGDESILIEILDCRNGKSLARLTAAPLSVAADEIRVSVSADAKMVELVARSDALRDPLRVLRWHTDSWKPANASSDNEPKSDIDPIEWRIVKIPATRHSYRTTYQVEVRQPGAAKPSQVFGPFDKDHPASFFPDHQRIAIDKWLIDLPTSTIREMPATIRNYLPDGQRLLCTREYDRESAVWGLDIGHVRLPFIRRLIYDGECEQFVIVNAETGRELRRSQWIFTNIESAIVSSDGKTIVAEDSSFVLVWELPD